MLFWKIWPEFFKSNLDCPCSFRFAVSSSEIFAFGNYSLDIFCFDWIGNSKEFRIMPWLFGLSYLRKRSRWTKSCPVIGYLSEKTWLSRSLGITPRVPQENCIPFVQSKSYNDLAYSIKMAEYCPGFFFMRAVTDLDLANIQPYWPQSHLVNNSVYIAPRCFTWYRDWQSRI